MELVLPCFTIAAGLALGYASYLHAHNRLLTRKGLHGTGPGMTRAPFINDEVAANLHYIRTGKKPDHHEYYWN